MKGRRTRVMKTTGLIFIYHTRGVLRGATRGGAWTRVCSGDTGTLSMFGIGDACFVTWSRPVGWSLPTLPFFFYKCFI